MKACSTCKFYASGVTEQESQCRKNPPQVFPMVSQLGQQGWAATWPPTQPHLWCGEHESLEGVINGDC